MQLKQLAEKLKAKFIDEFSKNPRRPCRIFLSATDMNSRAVVRYSSDTDPNAAFDGAIEQLSSALGSIEPTILRADWVTDVEAMTWQDFNDLIGKIRRNYFKRGIALSPDFSIAFTELELNANRMLFDGQKSNGAFNAENANVYCRVRFNRDFPTLQPSNPVAVFETNGVFVHDGEEPQSIDGAEHRHVSPLDSDQILSMAKNGAQHLARQIQSDGRFIYGLLPCTDQVVPSYNTLRHFSSIFAMLDVYEALDQKDRNEELKRAIIRGLDYAVQHFVRWRQLDDGTQAAYIEEPSSKEFKLGALGVPIVALAKFSELMRTQKYFPLMKALARGIYTMQQSDGSFVHVLNSTDFTVKQPFRIVYYDGEAVFGMMKLYSLTRDPKLLEASKLAFKRFIATDHWKNHDHWLSYAVNELTKYEPRKELFEFGIKNFIGHLHFIYHRDTQYPTLMELMMAADTMLERMKSMPDMSELLSTVNFDDFYEAMEARMSNMLNGYFYPETAMFFARPNSIVGSFFMRHYEFRARNDDIEHFLSGFVAYRRYLSHRTGEPKPSAELLQEKMPVKKLVEKPIRAEVPAVVSTALPPVEKKNIRPSGEAEIFFAGDLVIARRMHWRAREVKTFGNIPPMRDADLRIVNLESVVSNLGEQGQAKGEGGPYYYHARPEQLNIVTKAGIEVVLTANNHTGDYGRDAVVDQLHYLDEAGLIHVGSGRNVEEASKPVFVKANDLNVAIFSVDATMKYFASTEDQAGVWYLPPKDTELWRSTFTQKIADARKVADIVLVAPHWGLPNIKEPLEYMKTLGRVLIDCGADAVLGCHSHNIHYMEKYNERPIVYDTGDFLFEIAGREHDKCCLSLTADRDGIKKLRFIPLKNGYGYVVMATRSRDRINNWFAELCRAAGTEVEIKDGAVELNFNPPPRAHIDPTVESAIEVIEPSTLERHLIPPSSEPRPEWIVERVPDEAIIAPKHFGPLKLVGYRVPPECRTMTKRRMLYVETYWTIDQPVESDCRLWIIGKPVRECKMPTFGSTMEHDFCDWLWPVNRWKPGVIYRERFGLRPPDTQQLVNVNLQVEIRVRIDGKLSDAFIDPKQIELHYSHTPYYRTQFPDVIYQSKPGQCWNAEQLEAVTGGKWIVPPPEGWFVQSLSISDKFRSDIPLPTMFVACTGEQYTFHAEWTSHERKWDFHDRVAKMVPITAGAIVSHPVAGLPKDYPLLQVDNPLRAAIELGFAARKRFQGKMIGITGSSGKTTTTGILKHVFQQEHEVTASYGSFNLREMIPLIFTGVKTNTAFAIIEMAANAMRSSRGSLTFDMPPHIAVVTSILPVHLEHYKTLENVALFKSRIVYGMAPGGYAVFNRDMPYYEIFEQRAKNAKLNIITFGTHPEATIRMDPLIHGGTFEYNGKTYTLECPVPNEQLYDALAVVGVSIASGYSIEKTLEHLKTFETVKGRGNLVNATFNGKNLRLIDSTYNANVTSMTGALEYLRTLEIDPTKRVAMLGDIAELGKDEVDMHRQLAGAVLKAQPDRVLLAGTLMKNLWDNIKDQVRGAWFPTYKELLQGMDGWLSDGDTVLLKSSHATQFYKIVDHLSKQNSTVDPQDSIEPTLNVPSALFDVKEFLPEGITPELNGRMPMERMMQIDCGGLLYVDAARSFNAMNEAAERDGVFFRVNNPFNCYRTFQTQEKVFKQRLKPIGADNPPRAGAIRVEFENQIWQLNEGEAFAQVPGQSSHSYGLAVDIQNIGVRATRDWLNANAAQFGFVREFDFEDWHYTYVKSKEGIPARVLEIEALPPAKTWTADQIVEASGAQWYGDPPTPDWNCRGLLRDRPLKTKMLAVLDQGSGIGFDDKLIRLIFRQCAGIICTQTEELLKYKKPLLVTTNIVDTVNRLEMLFNGN